jgi:hypothetical protein
MFSMSRSWGESPTFRFTRQAIRHSRFLPLSSIDPKELGEPAKPLASPASRSNCLISTFLAERLGFKRDFANGSTFCGLATENCGSGSWWKGHSSH